MPYIKGSLRDNLFPSIEAPINSSGELNYVLTEVIKKYMSDKNFNYQVINDIIGALECCKQEYLRRVVFDYEDSKIEINGDVYYA